MIVISVSTVTIPNRHRLKSGRMTSYPNKRLRVYGIENGKFMSFYINKSEKSYWKSQIQKVLTFKCESCDYKFRSNKSECPLCSEEAEHIPKASWQIRTRDKGVLGTVRRLIHK